jgi:putative hydrolase of the HAD superfamily
MAPEPSSGAEPRGFAEVEAWIFDLDNTLYPPSCRLFELIDQRMSLFIAHRFGLDGLSARALQKSYYRHYGTTLRGLMTVDGVDPHEFMDFVHDIDHGRLTADPGLATAIGRLPGKRFILTNGSVRHAEGVARAIGIHHLFDGVFDIAAADFVPKPDSAVYELFLAHFNVEPTRAAMFEDLAHNLVVPHRMGMTTVLVTPVGEDAPERMRHADDGTKGPHVDYVTDDLTAFLLRAV